MNLIAISIIVGIVSVIVWLLTYKSGYKSGELKGFDDALIDIYQLQEKKRFESDKKLVKNLDAINRTRERLRKMRDQNTSSDIKR